jgi:3-isopropylmalate dehydrogenase
MDLLIVRELVGGLYYGDKGRTTNDAFDTCVYSRHQIERVARRGFDLARDRGQRLTSVDKANVLETSRLWREVVTDIGASYPDVELDHVLVDAAGLGGGLGLAASASLSDGGPGVFEPVHGSAPDIAGLGIANPVAMLRSVVLMFTYGLARPDLAEILDSAIERAIELAPTPDLGGCATTSDVTAAVLSAIAS